MATTDENGRLGETRRLRNDIETLRAIIDAELDAGEGANRVLLLAEAKLLREKKERLKELESPG